MSTSHIPVPSSNASCEQVSPFPEQNLDLSQANPPLSIRQVDPAPKHGRAIIPQQQPNNIIEKVEFDDQVGALTFGLHNRLG